MALKGKGPSTSLFAKQELHASKLIILPKCFSIAFAIIGAVSMGIGFAFLDASEKVLEYEYRYDEECDRQAIGANHECLVSFELPDFSAAEGDVFVYYRLKNFYQNFKEYVKNMNGEIYSSQFNDTFAFVDSDGAKLAVDETDIAWPNDKQYKMRDSPHGCANNVGKKVPDCYNCTDEKCLVWSRVAALQDFLKLYGKVEEKSKLKGKIEVKIQNEFPVKDFKGEKFIVLSTMSWAGGKNNFLGIVSVAYGGVCFVLVLGVQLMAILRPRELGDLKVLNKAK